MSVKLEEQLEARAKAIEIAEKLKKKRGKTKLIQVGNKTWEEVPA